MVSKIQYNELDMQLILLEYIANEYKGIDHYVALEARYSLNDRRADVLVVIENKYTHAYEIKSDIDSLDRLTNQLFDYRHTFDFVTVVTTSKYEKKTKNILNKKDGLLILDNNEVNKIKAPIQNNKIYKRNLITMCSKPVLLTALGSSSGGKDYDDVYGLSEKWLKLEDLRNITFKELERRFKSRYQTFIDEARIPYRDEDLFYLKPTSKLAIDFL